MRKDRKLLIVQHYRFEFVVPTLVNVTLVASMEYAELLLLTYLKFLKGYLEVDHCYVV